MEPPTPSYMVECYWPAISQQQAKAALSGIARSPQGASPSDRVWPLGCALVPSDGMALFLVGGPSAGVIRDVGHRIQLPFDRIVQSIWIEAPTSSVPAHDLTHRTERSHP
jgi:hypothetical protein